MKKRIFALALSLLLSAVLFPAYTLAEGETAPVEITDAAGMLAIADDPAGQYLLAADIDMSGVDWLPIPFSGTFDGGGHVLYNLSITRVSEDTSITYDGCHRGYHTVYASLFSYVENAVIENLTLLNVKVNVTTDQPCFAAGIAGHMEYSEISGCTVSGRIFVQAESRQCGVGGIAGFGNGLIQNCDLNIELTVVATPSDFKCEQYLGGVLANGYADIDGCSVVLAGYASVHGYAHNGGLVGLDDINPRNREHSGYVKNCTLDASISFYEETDDRRAYCKAYIGEKQNKSAIVSGNETTRFISNESTDYSRPILPDMDENPVYEAVVTAPRDTAFGYTTYTNPNSGYSYTDDYTAPAHTPGEWITEVEPTYESEGVKRQYCEECGELLAEETIPKLVAVSSCQIDRDSLRLPYESAVQLTAEVLPADAKDGSVTWSSSDESVASVSQTGLVTAEGVGSAVITCRSNDGFASSACSVEVCYTTKQKIVRYVLFGWLWDR
jgi:hypothetical protein